MTRILIADDSPVMRRTLREIVSRETEYEICGEAADGEEAVLACAALKPDVVVLDISMPTMGGLEAAGIISRDEPETKLILLTLHTIDKQLIERAQRNGFQAVLDKGQGNLLPKVIDVLLCGGTFFTRTD